MGGAIGGRIYIEHDQDFRRRYKRSQPTPMNKNLEELDDVRGERS